MSNITAVAKQFFEACETGKGWEGCRAYCTPDASFSAQAEPLADIRTLQGYADWMKGLLTFMPDGRYVVKSFATDDDRNSVCAYGVFSATHTGSRRPLPANRQEHDDRLRLCDGFRRGTDPADDESLERRMGHEGTRLGLTRSSQPLSALLGMQSCRRWRPEQSAGPQVGSPIEHLFTERESRRCSLPLTSIPCPSLELPGNPHGLPSEDYSGHGNIAMKSSAS